MNRFANTFLMIIPAGLLDLLVIGMLICGGVAMVVGARRLGGKLVLSAIALPFFMLLIEAIMDDVFAAMPDFLVMPVAFLITVVFWLMFGWAVLRVMFGQAVLDNARGILLADAIRAGAHPLLSRPLVLIGGLFLAYLLWSLA